ncbi:unnamed protein product [Psylliodes chrysocephalus]|uniref:Uncharacterized protein n=1 Tax=Psylliodes chrysocephalus TaxID=3402493 RepID=A0A9P0G7X4_9CUCU|nr:unnamed protein product [Psylliodes chrysocephala]
MLQFAGVTITSYIFLGIVHNVFLPAAIVGLGNATCSYKVMEIRKITDRCIINENSHSEDIYLNDYISSPYQLVLKRCSLKPQLDECLEKSISVCQDCLNSTHLKGIDVWKQIDNEVAAYICEDNALIAKDLLEKGESSCWGKGISVLTNQCLLNYKNPLPLYDIEGIGKQCSQLEDLESCFEKNELPICYQNVFKKTTKKIMAIVRSHMCKNN